jgi:branched-chain amino acid transport system substrate-binding protein
VDTLNGNGARRLAVGAAVLTIAALAAAGCSSSSGGGGGSSTGAPTGTGSTAGGGSSAAAPSGSPIKIGVIATLSGPQASSSNQAATVAPAWADYVNKQLGGINGHPVVVSVKDDAGQPTTAASVINGFVNDKVVAILAGSDNLVPAFSAITIKAGIPLVSGTANSADWYTKPLMYPTVTDVASGLVGQMLVAKQFGKAKKFADLYCAEVAACKQADPPLKQVATKLGVGFTSLAISSTATSYTAQCLALKQSGVDYAQLNFTTSAAAKFIADCQAQGYNPTWGTSEQSIGAPYLKLSKLTAFGPAYAFPSAATGGGVSTFTSAMTKYAKDDNWKEGTASFDWTGLVAIQKALASVSKTAAVTAQDVTNGLDAFKGETLDGIAANKLTFTKGTPVAFTKQPCFFVVGVKDGKVTAPNALTPICPGG